MAKKPVQIVEDLNEEVLPTEDSIETVELITITFLNIVLIIYKKYGMKPS